MAKLLENVDDRKAKKLWKQWNRSDFTELSSRTNKVNQFLPEIERAAKKKGLL